MRLLCTKVLAADSVKPRKINRHLETMHSEYKIVPVPSNALLASYKVSYRIANCKKPHTIGETLVLPAAIDMIEIMFGKSYAKQLRQIPIADIQLEEVGGEARLDSNRLETTAVEDTQAS
ncbi:protein FAM200B-like [Arctopsyche grandis]|uniref:protein FAM200B-like n=1 Tax=Arctopsyche grandis TaxID=121162 RepID=UPI00406D65F6